MKNSIYPKLLFVCCYISLLLSACTTEVDWESEMENYNLDQAIIIPIGHTDLTAHEILQQIDSIDFLDLSNGNNIYFSLNDSSTIEFEPINSLGSVNTLISTFPLSGKPITNGYVEGSFQTNMYLGINTDPSAQRIDSAYIKQSILGIGITIQGITISPSDINISISFPDNSIKFDNTSITKINFTPQKLGTEEQLLLNAFKYYTLNGKKYIPVKFDFKVRIGNSTIPSPSNIILATRFKSMQHRVIFGYFSPSESLTNSTLKGIRTFNISEIVNEIGQYGIFKFAEPEVKFEITNYMGLKLNLHFNKVIAYRNDDPTFDSIYANFNGSISKTETILGIEKYGDPSIISTIKLNHEKENGQLHLFFEKTKLPTDFKFHLGVSNARTSSESFQKSDFITDIQKIKLKKTLRVPLKLNNGSYFNFNDTIKDLDLDSLLEHDDIQQAQLAFKITNKLPINCRVNATFLDQNNQQLPLDLLSSNELKAPAVDNTGTVIPDQKFESSTMYLKILKSQIEDLKKVKKIAISVFLNTIENRPMNFQKNDAINIKLGLFIQGNVIVNQSN